MQSDDTLGRVIAMAAAAHAGQVDKAGEPYILHPLRVMLSLRSEDERIVAVLHDIVEDTSVTANGLLSDGLSQKQVDAVMALTRIPHEPYEDFIQRVAANPLARTVKLADIADNMSPARAASRPERLTERYTKAWIALGGAPAALAPREPSEAEVLKRALVEAVIPLEALILSGINHLSPEMQEGIRHGAATARAAMADR